jgi:hypothetical protein
MARKLTFLLLLTALLPAAALAKGGQPKQDVCDLDKDSGTFSIINVAAPAVPAHLAHGDHLPITFWADADGDDFGAGPAMMGCVVPPGFVENDDDCDDTNAASLSVPSRRGSAGGSTPATDRCPTVWSSASPRTPAPTSW